MLGLVEGHSPQIHKNIPSGNTKLKAVKHLIEPRPWSCRRDLKQRVIRHVSQVYSVRALAAEACGTRWED